MNELLSYVAGTMSDEEAAVFEERLFDDASLADDAARFVRTIDHVRDLAGAHPLVPVVTEDELSRWGERFTIAEHRAEGGWVRSRLGDEEFVAARIPVATESPRVHVELCSPDGEPYFRVQEAPFDPVAGEVILLCERTTAFEQHALRVRVFDDDEQLVGELSIENV